MLIFAPVIGSAVPPKANRPFTPATGEPAVAGFGR
jgi:hypothetical protein